MQHQMSSKVYIINLIDSSYETRWHPIKAFTCKEKAIAYHKKLSDLFDKLHEHYSVESNHSTFIPEPHRCPISDEDLEGWMDHRQFKLLATNLYKEDNFENEILIENTFEYANLSRLSWSQLSVCQNIEVVKLDI